MDSLFVSPMDERPVARIPRAARLPSLAGATVGLLDISKPRGREFLDRLELLLHERGVGEVRRLVKPTFARVAPDGVIEAAAQCDAVIEALAD